MSNQTAPAPIFQPHPYRPQVEPKQNRVERILPNDPAILATWRGGNDNQTEYAIALYGDSCYTFCRGLTKDADPCFLPIRKSNTDDLAHLPQQLL